MTVRELLSDIRSGTRSIIEGHKVTLYNLLFRERVTDRYPHRRPEDNYQPGPGYRGGFAMVCDAETGAPNCVACMACVRICPDQCIQLEAEGKGKERKPTAFRVDLGKCMFCWLCVESCKFNALTMTSCYELSVTRPEDLVWDLPRLQAEGRGMTEQSRVQ